MRPTDKLDLTLAHTGVDVDIPDLDVQGAVLLVLEPRPALPAKVEDQKEGPSKISLEESVGIEVGPTNGPKSDVELGGEAEEVHDRTDIGTPDAKGGFEGEFVDAVAVVFPVKGVI